MFQKAKGNLEAFPLKEVKWKFRDCMRRKPQIEIKTFHKSEIGI